MILIEKTSLPVPHGSQSYCNLFKLSVNFLECASLLFDSFALKEFLFIDGNN